MKPLEKRPKMRVCHFTKIAKYSTPWELIVTSSCYREVPHLSLSCVGEYVDCNYQ